ncbi:MAG: hypothetical protein ABIN80_21575 [Dyadobacter sp.]|uniref:hypothetical protein n=1 Tax=Dyadobacter sp. TaxID=1914288 RepID=UPI0032638074
MNFYPFSPYFLVGVYIIANILAFLLIFASTRYPKLTRLFFLLLFGWAFWINSSMAIDSPWVYQDYADSSIPLYKKFILGTFEAIMTPMVLIIAAGQALLAILMTLKGKLFKIGCWGGIVFCLAVSPIGSYAAFPATLFMAIALYLLQRDHNHLYIWERHPEDLKKGVPSQQNKTRANYLIG